MTTPSEQIQKDIKFNLARLRAADAEIAAVAESRCRLYRDTLARVQQYVEAKLAEQQAAAEAVAE